MTAVVGPSGAGKSTLLRLLNRLADPQRGVVRYRGRDVRTLDVLALRREVGLVPQLPALLPGSVADNVHYAARLAGRPADVTGLLDSAALPAGLADREATTMVGMLLAGPAPVDAVRLQLVLLYVLLGSVALAALIPVTLTRRRLIHPRPPTARTRPFPDVGAVERRMRGQQALYAR